MTKGFWGNSRPIAIAHRGGDAAGFGKRNTMAAFRSAHKPGYEYFETDVIDTKDGQVIVAHGAKTRLSAYLRGTFTLKTLRRLSYQEIRQRLRVDDEPIPLLEEVLKGFPSAKFLIDPKTDEVVEPLVSLIKRLGMLDNVLINSFKEQRLERVQQLSGNSVDLGLLIGRDVLSLKKLYKLKRNQLKHLELVSINHWLLNGGVVKQAKRQNLKILTWTVNSRRSIKRSTSYGVDGIVSDRVKLLKEAIKLID